MADHVVPQVDFPVEQLTVAVLLEGPRRHGLSRDDAQRLANEHVMYIIGLAEAGHLLHAGLLIDDGPQPALTGLSFSRLSRDELRPLLERDPSVLAGMNDIRLVTHSFPKGGLAFPRAHARTR